MTEEPDEFELVRGTGNVFADAGLPDAEREQLRAVLAAGLSGIACVGGRLNITPPWP